MMSNTIFAEYQENTTNNVVKKWLFSAFAMLDGIDRLCSRSYYRNVTSADFDRLNPTLAKRFKLTSLLFILEFLQARVVLWSQMLVLVRFVNVALLLSSYVITVVLCAISAGRW